MKKFFLSLLMLPLTGLFFQAFSQVHTYMKITASGLAFNGGVTVRGYENQIEVYSFADGLTGCATTAPGGAGACKVSLSPFDMIIPLSLAVNDLRVEMLKGKVISSIDLAEVKSSGQGPMAYYKIHMENVIISSIQEGAANESPTISVSVNPAKIAWHITSQNADGSAGPSSSTGWDFSSNRSFNYNF